MSVSELIVACCGAIFVIAFALAQYKQGSIKAAMATIEILKEQVAALSERLKQVNIDNTTLTQTVSVLQGQVTQAAPVRELMDWSKERENERIQRQSAEHEENLSALARLEGSLSRVESKVMRGE